jgi:hypothetical protein
VTFEIASETCSVPESLLCAVVHLRCDQPAGLETFGLTSVSGESIRTHRTHKGSDLVRLCQGVDVTASWEAVTQFMNLNLNDWHETVHNNVL